jgi:hypothetical protein
MKSKKSKKELIGSYGAKPDICFICSDICTDLIQCQGDKCTSFVCPEFKCSRNGLCVDCLNEHRRILKQFGYKIVKINKRKKEAEAEEEEDSMEPVKKKNKKLSIPVEDVNIENSINNKCPYCNNDLYKNGIKINPLDSADTIIHNIINEFESIDVKEKESNIGIITEEKYDTNVLPHIDNTNVDTNKIKTIFKCPGIGCQSKPFANRETLKKHCTRDKGNCDFKISKEEFNKIFIPGNTYKRKSIPIHGSIFGDTTKINNDSII